MPDYAIIDRKIETLRGLYIGSERDTEFASHLSRLLCRDDAGNLLPVPRRFTSTGETRGILNIGSAGSGKSSLVHHTLSKHLALAQGAFGQSRVIQCSVPSPATFKSVTLKLIETTGYKGVVKRTEAWSLWQFLQERLRLMETAVLWIDEAHDLFCADRSLILRAIKTLMQGDDAIVVILSGTEELGTIIRSDQQVNRRFSTMHWAPLTDARDADGFADLIGSFCARAGLEPPSQGDLIKRVFHAARYRFGRAIELIINAIEQALLAEDDALGADHFAEVWAMQEGSPAEDNVFWADRWWLIETDPKEDATPPPRSKQKRRAR